MPAEFAMPKLGLTMEEGLILEWLVEDGTEVTEGTPVLIIQTDKVDTEVEAPGSGRIAIIGASGESYACGAQIAWLLTPGEQAPAAAAPPPPASFGASGASGPSGSISSGSSGFSRAPGASGPGSLSSSAATMPSPLPGDGTRRFVSPNARRVAGELGIDVGTVVGTGPNGRVVSEDVEQAATASHRAPTQPARSATPNSGQPVLASFAASALAELIGIDLRTIAAAAGQRLERDDVVAHIQALIAPLARPASPAPTPAAKPETPKAAPAATAQKPTSVVPFTGMRGVIASRMHESLRDMAQLTLMMDVEMEAVTADRNRRKKAGSAPGYTDYVIAAAARALRAKPFANSQVTTDGVAILPDIHVGMAVALEQGLLVPVVRNTDSLGIEELSAETTRLATAARSNKLKLSEMEGGTFSVTALGMFGVDGFTPVINPPNAAILGVGRLRDDVGWTAKGTPKRVQRLTLSLTWDHRAFDGAPAAEFCALIKELLEDPQRIVSP